MQNPPNKHALSKAFSEMKANPPAILAQTKKKKGADAANKQRVAIAMSKARLANQTKAKGNARKPVTKQDVINRMQKRAMQA